MTTIPLPARCPVCESEGSMLHHDRRASLVYSCQKCMHEWMIDPALEPEENADGTCTGASRDSRSSQG